MEVRSYDENGNLATEEVAQLVEVVTKKGKRPTI
jgi:hypothetical protein